MDYEAIFPIKAIAFQILFLMVAIVIEAGILRQRLRLGFQTSVQYALVTNLARLPRDARYAKARRSAAQAQATVPKFTDTVIYANAASFSGILLLLLLRTVAQEWTF